MILLPQMYVSPNIRSVAFEREGTSYPEGYISASCVLRLQVLTDIPGSKYTCYNLFLWLKLVFGFYAYWVVVHSSSLLYSILLCKRTTHWIYTHRERWIYIHIFIHLKMEHNIETFQLLSFATENCWICLLPCICQTFSWTPIEGCSWKAINNIPVQFYYVRVDCLLSGGRNLHAITCNWESLRISAISNFSSSDSQVK